MKTSALSRAEILDSIGEVARQHLAVTGPVRAETRLIDDLRLDSLRLLTLAVEVENRFRVRLEPDEEASIATVGDLVDTVDRKLAARAAEVDTERAEPGSEEGLR